MKRIYLAVSVATLLIALGWLGSREPVSPLKAAEVAYRQGEYVRAIQIYDSVQQTLPDPGHAAFNRAAALYELGRFDQAAGDYHAASNSGDFQRTARACYELGNCALRRAVATRDRARLLLLREAIRQYDLCLAQSGGGDAKLLDDAWHNQQLARHMLDERSGRQPPPSNPNKSKSPDDCEH
jgi:tetratricopeptide (TPR) repeat protein